MDELQRPRTEVSFVQLLRASSIVCAGVLAFGALAWLVYRWYESWSTR